MSDYDVFLAHNKADKAAVEVLARRLGEESQLNPFIDEWNLSPGGSWRVNLQRTIDKSGTCALLLGPKGLGPWEHEEMRAYLNQRVQEDKSFRLIPVLLPRATIPERGELPGFLSRLVWVQFRESLDDSNAYHRLVSGIQGIVPGPSRTLFKRLTAQPYRGLEKFGPEDAEWFFGRDAETQQLVEKLKKSRFLAVLGASGSGKSSVVLAGLVPALQKGALPDSRNWPVLIFTPTAQPLEELAVRLTDLLPGDELEGMVQIGSLVRDLEANENALHMTVRQALKNLPDSRRVVLVVDQFEEAFTLCQDAQSRQQFFANLLYASEIHGGRTVVVLTMRADFLAKCAEYPDLADRLSTFNFFVTPMVESQLRDAIEMPAARVGLSLEPGLADLMLKEVIDQAGGLPLLEHTLLELWKRRDKEQRKLTVNAYHEIGEVTGALAHTADATYDSFNEPQRLIAERILLQLVQPGEGTEDTRRRAKRSELVTRESEAEMVEVVLQRLADQRLITTTQERDTGETVVNIAHEALIRNWPRLRRWIDDNRENMRIHRRLREDAEEWERLGRDEGALYRGVRLAQTEEWAQEHRDDLNQSEQEFIKASKQERTERETQRQQAIHQELELAKEQQQRLILQRWALGGLSLLLAVVIGVAIFAFYQTQIARQQTRIATAGQLAAQAQDTLEQDPQRSLLLAVEALHVTEQAGQAPAPSAEQALRDALANTGGIGLSGHSKAIRAVAMNDRWVVTASDDKTVGVWNLDQLESEPHPLSNHEGPIRAVAMTDQWLVIGSQDGSARVWDVSKNDAPEFKGKLTGHIGAINTVAISPDNQWVITAASNDNKALLWKLEEDDIKDAIKLTGHTKPVKSVAISNRWVLTASDEKMARLWDLRESEPQPISLQGHTGLVKAVAISQKWVITASLDGTARLWDPQQPDTPKHTLEGPSIEALAISDHGLVTASSDGTAHLWNLQQPDATPTNIQSSSPYISAMAIHDQWLVIANNDNTAHLWDLRQPTSPPIILKGHSAPIKAVAISDDWLLTGSSDNTARLWDRKQLQADPTILEDHSALINPVPISDYWLVTASKNDFFDKKIQKINTEIKNFFIESKPTDNALQLAANDNNGALLWGVQTEYINLINNKKAIVIKDFAISDRWLVTVSYDNTVRRWDLNKPEDDPIELNIPSGPITRVAISDEWLVGASNDNMVRLWDPNQPEKPGIELKGDSGVVDDMVINDHRLVTISKDNIARLWDLQQQEKERILLEEHEDRINAVAINDQSLVTASSDKTARLLNLQDLEAEPIVLPHENPVLAVAISPDNNWLVTGSADNTARLWDLQRPEAQPIVLRGHTRSILSVAISPDNHWLVTASSGKTVRLWNLRLEELEALACDTAGRNLSLDEWELYFRGQAYHKTCPDQPDHYSVPESKE